MLIALSLIAGAVLLVKGADFLIDGGAGIALKTGISPLVVGLTVVAFGTSAPELSASLSAALKGSGDICYGNVIGSNIANIALILGVAALIRPIGVNRALIFWEMPFLVFVSGLTYYVGIHRFAGRGTGLLFLVLFGVYLYHCMKSPTVPIDLTDHRSRKRWVTLIAMVVLGVAGLGFGGVIFVNAARELALQMGVSEALVGLTVVAVGTSLPELITSAIAAYKQEADISLGNIIGSNIFNILLVLGATSTLRPFPISHDPFLISIGLPFMMSLAVIIMPFALTGRNVSRLEGGVFFFAYVVYLILAVMMA